MNVDNLLEKIDLFNELVIESGFKRDIEAYKQALQRPETQANLVALKDIANAFRGWLEKLESTDLEAELHNLFPRRDTFMDKEHLTQLQEFIDNPSIDTATFFNRLNTQINATDIELKDDEEKIKQLRKIFSVYSKRDVSTENPDNAVMSIIFRDLESTKTLKSFARALDKWNTTLFLYHQMITSESPKQIELVEVQNGSIDVIFSIRTDVAINLAELFKVALYVFGMYLTYKSRLHEIIPTFLGNRQLIELEKQKEALMLDNVKEEVQKKLLEQFEAKRAADPKINDEGIDVKVTQISSHIADQIIRGNEIKLLAAPKSESEDPEAKEEIKTQNRELREQSQMVRDLLNALPSDDMKLLLERYKEEDKEENKEENKKLTGRKKTDQ